MESVLYGPSVSGLLREAVPFLWKVLDHKSAAVAFPAYGGLLRLSWRILHEFPVVMLLADCGFANQNLLQDLQRQENPWH